ncbi:MAG: phenylalanine--tRNA ligase subunit alpha [Bradymonadia bacterium]
MSIEVIKKKEQDALALIEGVCSFDALRDFEVQQVGKKGEITQLSKLIGTLPGSERRAFGQAVNESKGVVLDAIQRKRDELTERQIESELSDESFDPTRTDIQTGNGTLHPLTIVQEELEEIFSAMGFMVLDYPEIEDEFHNFEALNIPADHPARDMQDTFWLKNGSLLRTHTSPGQIRAMGEFQVPFRAVFPGKVFRYEAVDASHEHTFHQIEGLMVASEVSVANLISVMKTALSEIFRRDVEVRLRPGYFPFVEPGFELDMRCLICGGSGCKVCKNSGWVEFLGCGLVHPNVLTAAGLDPNKVQGWAFGMGLSRLVMMRYQVDDIRHLMSGDIRFLKQFKGGARC